MRKQTTVIGKKKRENILADANICLERLGYHGITSHSTKLPGRDTNWNLQNMKQLS
jgi:hypothetical protein